MNRYSFYGITLEMIVVMFAFFVIFAGIVLYSLFYGKKEPK
ncbi:MULTISPECIES: hypothetical protein [Paenibacillus]|uniref:Uncharacterized protein n=1 Tax=Paenibacillus radicis (ex Xue et al. 2023) TaxID=2972489 RepID=A0ABT1Y9L8_9BACL|nr:hypothetical protein [Paenibacillus radicis (ex Xue et al. 2023)]MCR8629607.1 hypothetical protein [Paenibacillus radicis (ex Xue et al. 2023)]